MTCQSAAASPAGAAASLLVLQVPRDHHLASSLQGCRYVTHHQSHAHRQLMQSSAPPQNATATARAAVPFALYTALAPSINEWVYRHYLRQAGRASKEEKNMRAQWRMESSQLQCSPEQQRQVGSSPRAVLCVQGARSDRAARVAGPQASRSARAQPCFCLLACRCEKWRSVRCSASSIDTWHGQEQLHGGRARAAFAGSAAACCARSLGCPQRPTQHRRQRGLHPAPSYQPATTHLRRVSKVSLSGGAGEGAVGGGQRDARGSEVALRGAGWVGGRRVSEAACASPSEPRPAAANPLLPRRPASAHLQLAAKEAHEWGHHVLHYQGNQVDEVEGQPAGKGRGWSGAVGRGGGYVHSGWKGWGL